MRRTQARLAALLETSLCSSMVDEPSSCVFRRFPRFTLPSSIRTAQGRIRYESLRTGERANGARCAFDYAAGAELPSPAPGSLAFFLVERYRLHSSALDGLWRGAVFHEPYPLCSANVTAWDENLLALDGFTPPGRRPDHVIMSRRVDVTIFPLERV